VGAHYSIKVKVRKVRNSHFEGDMYAQYEGKKATVKTTDPPYSDMLTDGL